MSGTHAPDLFPAPSPPPSTISPTVWPGVSPTSTAALQRVLKDNHQKWHIFFNDKGFHKYVALGDVEPRSLAEDYGSVSAMLHIMPLQSGLSVPRKL